MSPVTKARTAQEKARSPSLTPSMSSHDTPSSQTLCLSDIIHANTTQRSDAHFSITLLHAQKTTALPNTDILTLSLLTFHLFLMPHHMSLPFMPSCLILRDDRKQDPAHRKEFSLPSTTAVEADTALGADNICHVLQPLLWPHVLASAQEYRQCCIP